MTSMKERIGEVGSSQVKHFGTFLIPERKIEGRSIAEALFIIFIPAKAAEAVQLKLYCIEFKTQLQDLDRIYCKKALTAC